MESTANDRFDLTNLENLPTRQVPIDALTPGPYLRQAGTSAAHVKLLFGVAGSSELPPILVQQHGWRVVDGLHRLEVARLRGDRTIKARFLDCTDGEALVLAIKSNTSHGLPLSKADRVRGAMRVLAEHPDWSDRAIAGITGLSAKTIASLRTQSAARPEPGDKRLGLDGKRRPVSAGDGRKRVAEYITAHPDAPLRQVARATDVSLGTVHDVSSRIRRGADPECTGRRAERAGRDTRPALVPLRPVQERADSPAAPASSAPLHSLGPADAGSLRSRKRHVDAQPTWSAISAKVANDPAIRYTQSGKEFLRWMSLHAAHPDEWRSFADAVPVHWISVIAPIADSLSREWGVFADQLRNRQGAAS